jgi:crotonobetainyl-CoA:carnitine CoA-transferase CaiB-like acyl-CoA transferase
MTSAIVPQYSGGFLQGVRVLEVGNELGEYCGKLLAGVGADVIKVEPPGGELTRQYGPFYEDKPGPERSLYFWHYNFGKRGVRLDLDTNAGQETFRQLVADAAVVLDARPKNYMAERQLGYETLRKLNPSLVMSRISPFGDAGPWGQYKGSDLVHLALGGVMMNCGYDPDPYGFYEIPPIAPQMWQAYQIAGEMAAMAILGALYHRLTTGQGQYLHTSVHSAVAAQTETDVPNWIFLRKSHLRQTGRHSRSTLDTHVQTPTKDGRYLFPFRSYSRTDTKGLQAMVALLAKYGMAEDLLEPQFLEPAYANKADLHIAGVVDRFVARFMYDREIWREFQAIGMTWAPVRRPEENTVDEHWRSRETFLDVHRPELGKTFVEVGAKWMCPEVHWRPGPRSPLLGEHNDEILQIPAKPAAASRPEFAPSASSGNKRKRPLEGIKFIELSWLLASAGAGRYIAALGADVVKVEHKSRWDLLRWVQAVAPPGGRKEREQAAGPLPDTQPPNPNRGGFFHDINAGKRSISLNLKHPRGKEILSRLLEMADVVGEGFSPGTMDRMGFGYERLKQINPRIVYVQQSGMGQIGRYGEMRSYGPVAQAFSGLTEMSGMPEPYPPAGIGYSYLDWFGAYNMANAILAGLYRQKLTGKGCWIDSSQVESGTYLNGTAILDYSTNKRQWSRYGNRSPYQPAAPHGAFRAKGDDRWIAIACFTDQEWKGLLTVLGNPAWGQEPRFLTLSDRIAHQDELDALLNRVTAGFEPYELQEKLQAVGVAAGVCQTSEDRCDIDPQLKSANWLVELPQTEIGTWPCKEFPTVLSDTPVRMGGTLGRHGPNYGEDNEYIYGEWLGYSVTQIRELEREDVI